jgi:hypothetical protein
MKARHREVNIFNMSLLDILCGALGAFCFMMLVLFPYWKPAGAQAKDVEREYQQALQELENLKKRLANLPDGQALVQQLQQLLKRFQAQQAQLNKALNDAERARREAEAQRKQLEEAQAQLSNYFPLLVTVNWTGPGQDVDLYLRSRSKTKDGRGPPAVDAAQKQGPFFSDHQYLDCLRGPCSDTWLIPQMWPGKEVEVYLKLVNSAGQPARLNKVFARNEAGILELPEVTLTGDKTAVFAGVLKVMPDKKIAFTPQNSGAPSP